MIKHTGCEYTKSNLNHWAEMNTVQYTKEHNQIIDWCLDNFGIDNGKTWRYSITDNIFYFTKQEDMLLFILRWS